MTAKLEPEITRQTMAGYAEVNKITEAERRARLRKLTDAEALAIFDDLCATWERLGKDGGDWERLNRVRIEHKVKIRQVFERLARAQGAI